MADLRRQRGTQSEQLAADYLKTRGLLVLARNLRCRAGELDLVCLDQEVLAVIEVRQRCGQQFGGALQSVSWRKQRKIIRATRFFLLRQADWHGRAVRFDVIAVEGPPDGVHRLVWVKDAFRAT
ncbi:MAG TPA: YraN family protein [Steroidobacteraceae bacterium]|jgi:putative endonuclease|nr:YraN family protein [Steroidobacteraceae bacterium]